MKAQYGSIAVPYGSLHTFTWGSFTAPVNGGDEGLATVRLTNRKNDPGSDSPVFYYPCATRGGPSHIFNVDLATKRFTVSRPVSNMAGIDCCSPGTSAGASSTPARTLRSASAWMAISVQGVNANRQCWPYPAP